MAENFLRSLQQADAALQRESLSPKADNKLRARLLNSPEKNAEQDAKEDKGYGGLHWLYPGLALGVSVLCFLFLNSIFQDKNNSEVAGFLVIEGQATAPASKGLLCQSTSCQLEMKTRQTQITAARTAQIQRKKDHLRVWKGKVTLDVSAQPDKTKPFRIYVSHGYIEVMGTHFTIKQQATHGQVTLHHGKIRFVYLSGRTKKVHPGQTLHWPFKYTKHTKPIIHRRYAALKRQKTKTASPEAHPPEKKAPLAMVTSSQKPGSLNLPQKEKPTAISVHAPKQHTVPEGKMPSHPAKSRKRKTFQKRSVSAKNFHEPISPTLPRRVSTSTSPGTSNPKVVKVKRLSSKEVTVFINNIARLRAQGRYQKVAEQLEKALPKLTGSTRERLSYELGSLLSFQLRSFKKACQHWKQHQKRFAKSSRYSKEILDWQRILKCKP